MKKIFVLDTSALIDNPHAYDTFEDAEIIIPIAVLNELDNLKKQMTEAGRNARVATRTLDEKTSGNVDIVAGIPVGNDCLLKIDATYRNLKSDLYEGLGDPTYGDTQILACALEHLQKNKDTVLISNDINLRMKAKSRGLAAQTLEIDDAGTSDIYSGVHEAECDDAVQDLFEMGGFNPKDYELALYPNEFVEFYDERGDYVTAGRRTGVNDVKAIKKHVAWGISARNREQALALDILMDKNIDLCSIIGCAGTGKTLIALAACMELVVNKRFYDKMIVYRPVQVVGNDIGYLPGTMEEKLGPHFSAIMDSFEVLLTAQPRQGKDWKRDLEMLQTKGQIELDAITFIRGRSISNAIILVDEVQNLRKEDIKTILTRAGEGTKIILTGDIEQIDDRNLDALNNGLSYVIEKFKKSSLAGHITLTQGERSRLATEAAKLL